MVSKVNFCKITPSAQIPRNESEDERLHQTAKNLHEQARNQSSRIPLSNRRVDQPKQWSILAKVLALAVTGLAIGILMRVIKSVPPTPIGYTVDPKICDPDTGVSFKNRTTCNPLSPICSFDPKNRIITLMSVYDNSRDPERDVYTDFTNELNRQYAEKYGIDHVVIKDAKKFIEKQCTNPLTKENVDCELYWVKVYPFVQACAAYEASPPTDGKEQWIFSWDTDGVIAEDFNPYDFIDQVRVNEDGTTNDASIIMPKDSNPWTASYTYKRKIDSRYNANTGFIAARIDDSSCLAIKKWWESRNSIPDRYHWKDCLTLGICPKQHRSLQEQQAVGVILDDHPCLKNLFHIIKVRNLDSKTRQDFVINALYGHDKYCFMKCSDDECQGPFAFFENSDHPHVYRTGDHWAQPNAFPTRGKLAQKVDGKCPPLEQWKDVPVEQVRFRLIKELCEQSSKKAVCEEILRKP